MSRTWVCILEAKQNIGRVGGHGRGAHLLANTPQSYNEEAMLSRVARHTKNDGAREIPAIDLPTAREHGPMNVRSDNCDQMSRSWKRQSLISNE